MKHASPPLYSLYCIVHLCFLYSYTVLHKDQISDTITCFFSICQHGMIYLYHAYTIQVGSVLMLRMCFTAATTSRVLSRTWFYMVPNMHIFTVIRQALNTGYRIHSIRLIGFISHLYLIISSPVSYKRLQNFCHRS